MVAKKYICLMGINELKLIRNTVKYNDKLINKQSIKHNMPCLKFLLLLIKDPNNLS